MQAKAPLKRPEQRSRDERQCSPSVATSGEEATRKPAQNNNFCTRTRRPYRHFSCQQSDDAIIERPKSAEVARLPGWEVCELSTSCRQWCHEFWSGPNRESDDTLALFA